ncbi:MAG: DUF192 domain-containing protein [Chloroflexi bacterium]|nr:DUF192 domain-containing protein [Chloroflexota bacterium]
MTFRRALAEDDGLLMDCGRASRYDSAIHMMGVFFDLGIIWLDERQMVVDCGLARRWVSVLAPTAPARYILEVCPGRLREFQPGDTIEFHEA